MIRYQGTIIDSCQCIVNCDGSQGDDECFVFRYLEPEQESLIPVQVSIEEKKRDGKIRPRVM